MRVAVSTRLDCSYERAVAEVLSPRLLRFVAWPLVRFEPLDPPHFPVRWEQGTYWVGLKILGVLPFPRQAVVISCPPVDRGFALRDAGHSSLIPRWDHRILITPEDNGVRYRDEVDIGAGLLTPLVWLFAQLFYRHRQRRWRTLAGAGFRYEALPGPDPGTAGLH